MIVDIPNNAPPEFRAAAHELANQCVISMILQGRNPGYVRWNFSSYTTIWDRLWGFH
jgi:hypothetical protein